MSTGISARIASAAWWIHSLASGATAHPDQDAAPPVGEQPERAAGVPLVGPRPVGRFGHGHLGGRHVDAAFAGLAGSEADGGDLGVSEHDSWDALVGGDTTAAQDVVGGDPALVLGHVGEQGDPGDVAYCPQPVGRAAVIVDRDLAGAGRHSDGVQVEPAGHRLAPGAEDHDVGLGLGAVVEGDDSAAARRAGPGPRCARYGR